VELVHQLALRRFNLGGSAGVAELAPHLLQRSPLTRGGIVSLERGAKPRKRNWAHQKDKRRPPCRERAPAAAAAAGEGDQPPPRELQRIARRLHRTWKASFFFAHALRRFLSRSPAPQQSMRRRNKSTPTLLHRPGTKVNPPL
jgi:hypothetical protein